MQNPPILRDGLENAALFPMSGPASWCILVTKRFKEVSTPQKKEKEWLETSLQNLFGIRKHHDAGPDIGKRSAFSRPSRRIGGFCIGEAPQQGGATPERFNA